MNIRCFAALAVLSGCAAKTPGPVASTPPLSPYEHLVLRVAEARDLQPKTKIMIFDAESGLYEETHKRVIGKPPPEGSRAFLDGQAHVIYTRGASEDQLIELINLALQNQHFDFVARWAKLGKTDAGEALEGFAIADTNLLRLLLSGPSRDKLAAHVAEISAMTPEKAVEAKRIAPAFLNEPAPFVRLVMAKQVRSLGLVTRLYLDGGWSLVNKAWAVPPTQLAHLDDPQSYIDGTREPAALPPIPSVPETTIVEDATLASIVDVYRFLLGVFDGDSFFATLYAHAQHGMSVRIVDRKDHGRAFVVVAAFNTPDNAKSFTERWMRYPAITTDCGPVAKQAAHAVVATVCMGKVASESLIKELLPKVGPLPASRALTDRLPR